MFFHSPSAATPRHKVDLLEEVSKCVKSGIQCILKTLSAATLELFPCSRRLCPAGMQEVCGLPGEADFLRCVMPR